MTTSAQTPTGRELDATAKPGEVLPGRVNRHSPAAQVGIVAAAIIPTMLLYVGYWLIPTPDDPYQNVAELAAFCLLYGVYFVGVIWLVNKYPRNRNWVLTAAILIVAFDTVVSCAAELIDARFGNAVNATFVAITIVYVAVWGVARRQTKSWMFGLPFAAIVSWVAQFGVAQFGLFQHPGGSYWWEPWTCFVGSFVIGCLLCWAFDLLGRRAKSRGEAPSS
jgi:hypothetical protein